MRFPILIAFLTIVLSRCAFGLGQDEVARAFGGNHPAAVIVAFNEYPKPRDLTHAVPSAIALAQTLSGLGYNVTFISGPEGVEHAGQILKGLPRLTSHTCHDGEHGQMLIERWIQETFLEKAPGVESDTPFGLMIFSGHAEIRRTSMGFDHILLTPADGELTKGISMRKLNLLIGSRRLPVVAVLDCCRTEGKPEAVSPPQQNLSEERPVAVGGSGSRQLPTTLDTLIDGSKGAAAGRKPRRLPGAVAPLTTLHATTEFEPAQDFPDNLLSLLNEGLKRDDKTGQFVARLVRSGVRGLPYNTDAAPLETDTDLSLLSLASFAGQSVAQASRHHRNFDIDPGSVDLTMICATSRKDGLYPRPPMDIASFLNGFTATGISAFHDESGLVYHLNDTITPANSYVTSFFVGQESPLEWRGKTLFIELVASCPEKGRTALCRCICNLVTIVHRGATCLMNWPFILYLLASRSNSGFLCPAMTIRSSNRSRFLLRPDASPNGLPTPLLL